MYVWKVCNRIIFSIMWCIHGEAPNFAWSVLFGCGFENGNDKCAMLANAHYIEKTSQTTKPVFVPIPSIDTHQFITFIFQFQITFVEIYLLTVQCMKSTANRCRPFTIINFTHWNIKQRIWSIKPAPVRNSLKLRYIWSAGVLEKNTVSVSIINNAIVHM